MGSGLLTVKKTFLNISLAAARLQAFFSTDTRLHKARFSETYELKNLITLTPPSDGLLLGTRGEQFFSVRPTKSRPELGNLLITAPTRLGKGLLAVSQLLSWQHSAVVNDIKGELYRATAGYRRTIGRVLVIDPTGLGNRFDPLWGKETEDEFLSIATQLLFEAEEKERIFTQRAIVMLTQMFLAAKVEGISPFVYIRFLVRLGLADTASRLYSVDPDLATQFLDNNFLKANLSDRFLLSAWGTLTARLRPLLTETVIRSLTSSDFQPCMLLQNSQDPITVYIRWKERDLLALSPLVRLLWGTLINEMITYYDNQDGAGCKPVLLLIDEAGRTAIPSLADYASTLVGRRIYLWVAIQSLSQLETVYGRARAQTIRDNMETQIYQRPSDTSTAEHVEDRVGLKSEYARSETSRQGQDTSEGRSERPVPLIAKNDITLLPDYEIIGFHRNLRPFKLERCDWRNNQLLRLRKSVPAPVVRELPPVMSSLIDYKEERFEKYTDPDLFDVGGEEEENLLN